MRAARVDRGQGTDAVRPWSGAARGIHRVAGHLRCLTSWGRDPGRPLIRHGTRAAHGTDAGFAHGRVPRIAALNAIERACIPVHPPARAPKA